MKKSFLTLLFAVVIFLDYSYAVPAKPTPMTVSLPDGTTLTVRLFGDESSHYYTTLDHYLLIQDQNIMLRVLRKTNSSSPHTE